eukprot:TRINITY_DN16957_c0_g1_i1.p1 TRINITY_DN16957_c0_g1~~TRINITY_DN16957_c0_g1_i1.p1  ORF type:complete len:1051 (+),score=169.59 TRINITY_DN16957_c0_g1_i1:431-3154(+)
MGSPSTQKKRKKGGTLSSTSSSYFPSFTPATDHPSDATWLEWPDPTVWTAVRFDDRIQLILYLPTGHTENWGAEQPNVAGMRCVFDGSRVTVPAKRFDESGAATCPLPPEDEIGALAGRSVTLEISGLPLKSSATLPEYTNWSPLVYNMVAFPSEILLFVKGLIKHKKMRRPPAEALSSVFCVIGEFRAVVTDMCQENIRCLLPWSITDREEYRGQVVTVQVDGAKLNSAVLFDPDLRPERLSREGRLQLGWDDYSPTVFFDGVADIETPKEGGDGGGQVGEGDLSRGKETEVGSRGVVREVEGSMGKTIKGAKGREGAIRSNRNVGGANELGVRGLASLRGRAHGVDGLTKGDGVTEGGKAASQGENEATQDVERATEGDEGIAQGDEGATQGDEKATQEDEGTAQGDDGATQGDAGAAQGDEGTTQRDGGGPGINKGKERKRFEVKEGTGDGVDNGGNRKGPVARGGRDAGKGTQPETDGERTEERTDEGVGVESKGGEAAEGEATRDSDGTVERRRRLQEALVTSDLPGKQQITGNVVGKENVKEFNVCICTVLWNAARFLEEWVMYHSHLGIGRFFIYDNESDDDIEQVMERLRPFNVSRHLWPWDKTQEAGFSHCAVRASAECEWMLFTDVDEFVFSSSMLEDGKATPSKKKQGKSSKQKQLQRKQLLEVNGQSFRSRNLMSIDDTEPGTEVATTTGVVVRPALRPIIDQLLEDAKQEASWRLPGNSSSSSSSPALLGLVLIVCDDFGPSGLSSLPASGQMMNYVCKIKEKKQEGKKTTTRTKSLVRLSAMDGTRCNKVHSFDLNPAFSSLKLRPSKAIVMHYKYQVWDIFKLKYHRRVATFVRDWTDEEHQGERLDKVPGLGTSDEEPLGWKDRFCDVEDRRLQSYVSKKFVGSDGKLPWE